MKTTGLILVSMVGGLLGCGDPSFPGSAGSLDALGQDILEAFRAGDVDALEQYRLTETEHNQWIWPELPAAQGDSPYPVDLAWQNIELRNRRALGRTGATLREAGSIEFESVSCEGDIRIFVTYAVHTDCYTRFRKDGALFRIQVFKDVVERNGGYKIFRYYDEDPELVEANHTRERRTKRGAGAEG